MMAIEIPKVQPGGTQGLGRKSVSEAMAPAEARARLFSQVQEITRHFQQIASAEQENRKVNEATIAADALYREESANPDYATLPERVQERMRTLRENLVGDIHDLRARQAFDARFGALNNTAVTNARSEFMARTRSQTLATHYEYMDTMRDRAVRAATPEELADALAEIQTEKDKMVGLRVISADKAQVQQEALIDEIQESRVVNDARTLGPRIVLGRLEGNYYEGLDPGARDRLIDQMFREIDRQKRDMEDAGEAARQQEFNAFLNTDPRKLTLDDARRLTSQPGYTDTEVLAAQKHVAGGIAVVSDPATLQYFNTEVYYQDGNIDTYVIDLAYNGDLISDADHTRLRNIRMGLERQVDEATRRAHGQGEEIIKTVLTVTGPMEALNQEAQQAWGAALEEYVSRSAGGWGTEDPRVLAPAVKLRLLRELGPAIQDYYNERLQALKYKSLAELPSRADAYGAGMSEAEYNYIFRQIQEVESLRERVVAIGEAAETTKRNYDLDPSTRGRSQ